jgi:hypothetical protein
MCRQAHFLFQELAVKNQGRVNMEDAAKKDAEKMPEPVQKPSKKRHRKKKNRQKPVNPADAGKQPSIAKDASAGQPSPVKPEDAEAAKAEESAPAAAVEAKPADTDSSVENAASATEPVQENAAVKTAPEDSKDDTAVLLEKTDSADSGSAAAASADEQAESKEEPINVVVKPDAAEDSGTEHAGDSSDQKNTAEEKNGNAQNASTAKPAANPAPAAAKNPEKRKMQHDSVLIYHPEEFRKPLDWKKMILNPQSCQEKEAEFNSEYCKNGIILIIIKCAVIALVFSDLIAKVLNRYSFSYVRMTFTGASWLALRLFLILVIAEAAYIGVTYLFHKIWQKPISCNRLVRVVGAGSSSSAAAYLISGLLWHVFAPLGAVAMIGAIVYSVILKTFGTAFLSSLTRRKQLVCVCFAYCAMALFVLIGFYLFAGDLVRVWNDIIAI